MSGAFLFLVAMLVSRPKTKMPRWWLPVDLPPFPYMRYRIGIGPSRASRQRAELRMQQPTDISTFGKDRFTELYSEWQRHASTGRAGSYDEWMDDRFSQLPKTSATLRQGTVVFKLRHGHVYAVRGDNGAERLFRVQLSRDFPHVSFRQASGVELPWVAFPGVFTQAELMTLRRVP